MDEKQNIGSNSEHREQNRKGWLLRERLKGPVPATSTEQSGLRPKRLGLTDEANARTAQSGPRVPPHFFTRFSKTCTRSQTITLCFRRKMGPEAERSSLECLSISLAQQDLRRETSRKGVRDPV